jgi:hypothetical protein
MPVTDKASILYYTVIDLIALGAHIECPGGRNDITAAARPTR